MEQTFRVPAIFPPSFVVRSPQTKILLRGGIWRPDSRKQGPKTPLLRFTHAFDYIREADLFITPSRRCVSRRFLPSLEVDLVRPQCFHAFEEKSEAESSSVHFGRKRAVAFIDSYFCELRQKGLVAETFSLDLGFKDVFSLLRPEFLSHESLFTIFLIIS
jgi:hypothetical protein